MKKILIISGGISKERAISLDTGKQVAKELKKNNYFVKITEPNFQLFDVIKKFKPNKNWYKDEIFSGENLNFNKKKDFVIIPEIWAHFAIDLKFAEQKINYAIFVQGFYHMNSTNNFINLKKSYDDAKLIITTSKYSVSYLNNMFPNLKKKIFKVNLSVDSNKFIECFNIINIF